MGEKAEVFIFPPLSLGITFKTNGVIRVSIIFFFQYISPALGRGMVLCISEF
jgi:hypothetical protein